MKKLKNWDPVIVIAGKHKWKISSIVSSKDDMVVVKGVNIVKKAVKGQWFIEKTLPIHVSNVMYYLEKDKKAVKLWIKEEKWKKVRFAKKENIVIK